METKSKIILPAILLFVGVVTVIAGRQGQVNADVMSTSNGNSLYVLLTAAGFLLIAVAAIIVLFIIASSSSSDSGSDKE
jgi:TRAP-type uncharacterized transport system fused permease subunit